MKEIKDVASSVLVLIVTSGDESEAVEALKIGARTSLLRSREKNVFPGAEPLPPPGTPASTVTLGQYHKIQQAVRYINDNYRTDLRLNAVAGEAGMSPSHFSRIFKKVMGLSYQGYLNDRRITQAKDLLRTSPRSVSEIASSLGFSDPTGFGRIFKKLTGQTPSAYRNLPRK